MIRADPADVDNRRGCRVHTTDFKPHTTQENA
jgi:hypothetical protein